MAQQVFGPSAVVSVLNRAFTNTSPSNAVFANQVAAAGTTDAAHLAFATSFGASFANGKTAADLSALLMTNMGITNAALSTALTDYIAANGTQNVGVIAWQLSSILSNLENDATYGAAAKAWNAEVTTAYEYSANPKNTTPSTGTTTGNEAGTSTVLTTAQDVLTGGAGNDFFRGVAGQAVGNQEQTTFNSSDIIDGGLGQDALILNLVGPYNGGARVKGIETLTLGTNMAAGPAFWSSQFDFNVNEGSNEISDVQTLEYDQINVGEGLQVNNIVKTAGTAGADLATLLWDNEAGSAAGTIDANYRASAVAGATNQNVILDDVAALNINLNSGRLNLGGGVETITITSAGNTANTLNNSFNVDGRNADLVSASNDGVNDNGALTKVVVKGAQAFGRAAAVVTNDAAGEANFGLTNRAVGNDLGLTNTLASASNLISVAGTVTEIDATEADGGVAMRFVGRADNGAVNVTFKGGKAADYIEFERGNINAAGGEGADTFAFVNNALTSFDFGSADTIVGGAGSDTIQLGVNGNFLSNVVANTTEFNNKTGVDVLDLRGAVNTVTLADAFVAGADAGLVVRSDRIVQSAASTANTTPSLAGNNNGVENAAVTTVVLTELAENRAVEFIGGTGSDRVVVDNASANQFTKLDGGSNVGTAATGAAGSTDSLTVMNTAVLDADDVANIKGFELVNLVESTVGNSSFGLTLSEAFVLANSTAAVPLTIASVTNTYGVRLGAGDVVNLEVSDLLTAAGAVKATIAARAATNVQDLIAAGVTVNFQVNGVTQSTNAAPAALAGVFNLATAPAATTLDDVTGAAIVNTGITFASGIGAQNVLGTNNNDTFTLSQADTVTGGTGTDTVTFNAGSGGARVTLGAGADTVNLNAAITSGTGFLQMNGGGTLNVNTAVGNMNANVNDYVLGAGTTVEVNVAQVGMTLEDSALSVNSNAGGTFTLGAAAQTFNGVGNFVDNVTTAATAAAQTVNTAAGNDIINVVVGTTGTVAINAGTGDDVVTIASVNGATYTVALGDGADTLRVNNAAIVVGDVNTVTVSDFNVGTDVFQSFVAGASIVTGAYVTANAAVANKITGQVGGNVIEILSSGVDGVQIAAPTTDASVFAALNQVMVNGGNGADLADGNYTVIGYQGANAYIYQVTIAGANGTGGVDDVVELVGVLSNVGADAMNAVNIA